MDTLLDASPESLNQENEKLRSTGRKRRREKCKRILLVEDNPITQLILLQQLKDLGCTALAAASGCAAIDARMNEQYDLILMDCRLPDMDGYATVRAIRAFEQRTRRKRVPIVAVTADDDVSCVEKCIDSGMDGHILKPMTPTVLRKLIDRLCN